MDIRLIMTALLIFFAGPAIAAEDLITIDLAQDHIDISMGFTGANLVLFGVREGPGAVAVVIRGPESRMKVRRKKAVLGAWINRYSMIFKDVPVYYDYALSVPEDELAETAVLKENGIGMAALRFRPQEEAESKETRKIFQDALIRNKQAERKFPKAPETIEFLSDGFFRADFYIPAGVPVGDYTVQTFYFAGGQVRDTQTTTIRVAHVGASADIRDFSREHAFIYGLLCVALAIFAGWFSNRVRRRA